MFHTRKYPLKKLNNGDRLNVCHHLMISFTAIPETSVVVICVGFIFTSKIMYPDIFGSRAGSGLIILIGIQQKRYDTFEPYPQHCK